MIVRLHPDNLLVGTIYTVVYKDAFGLPKTYVAKFHSMKAGRKRKLYLIFARKNDRMRIPYTDIVSVEEF